MAKNLPLIIIQCVGITTIFFSLVCAIYISFHSEPPQPPPSAFQPIELPASEKSFNFDVAITRGNHTYIPINRQGNPHGVATKILELVESFENSHPELSITEFQIEKQQTAHGVSDYIYGIWLHHKPK